MAPTNRIPAARPMEQTTVKSFRKAALRIVLSPWRKVRKYFSGDGVSELMMGAPTMSARDDSRQRDERRIFEMEGEMLHLHPAELKPAEAIVPFSTQGREVEAVENCMRYNDSPFPPVSEMESAPAMSQSGKLSRVLSNTSISPWATEYFPNPVMFPHLHTSATRRGVSPTSRSESESFAISDFHSVQGSPMEATVRADATTTPVRYTASSSDADENIPFNSSNAAAQALHSASSSGTPPSSFDTSKPFEFQCPECSKLFRTTGLKNKHINRTHRRRYTCDLCPSAFALNADLQRHKRTVHRSQHNGTRTLQCPNTRCGVPDKQFNRKDNFERHVARCFKRQVRCIRYQRTADEQDHVVPVFV
ncbi:hypothetical protein K491DRAFT_317422 [Lophiostoma macrostomum CBS 122681]|uniref:C2H2-type domain-containing protein n=1 Tax=Lophiostoma macrostomum CBS 122681 TaxID=1314788 RepID=A0A6A6SJY0_9PLEO|nr:hypothetical protein K491DRAFT_317422 [Lophiostoma macrostomum CBS 122681]